MSDDRWSGIFDLNGDGKTTYDEEMIAFDIIEESRKRNRKHIIPSSVRAPKAVSTIKPVPEVVDASNYQTLLSEYRTDCVCAIIALVLLLLPAIAVLWAVYSSYDPRNNASDFLTIIFTLAGIIYGGIVIHTTGKSIKISIDNISTVKKRYNNATKES